MAARRSTPAKTVDERRFRFRVRFERPAGIGEWDVIGFTNWLRDRLGRNGYGFHDDVWDGHGGNTYAIHLDDHTAIPELLAFIGAMGIERVPIKTYRAEVGANLAAALLEGIHELISLILDRADVIQGDAICRTTHTYPAQTSVGGSVQRLLKLVTMLKLAERSIATAIAATAEGQPVALALHEDHYEALCDGARVAWDLRFDGPAPRPETIQVLLDSLKVSIDYIGDETTS